MRTRTRFVLVVGAAAATAVSGGCKVQPVDGNVDRRQPLADEVVGGDGSGGPIVGSTIPVSGNGVGGGAAGTGSGGTSGGADLGPAARESLKFLPMGFGGAGVGARGKGDAPYQDTVPHRDRWRVGYPAWERGSQTDSPWEKGAWWDPYHQNVLKGDYPILGTQNVFLNIEAESITKIETKKVPIPSSPFTRDAGNEEFFGNFHVRGQSQEFLLTADLFHGETSFKPVDWRVLVKGATMQNYAASEENMALYADPSRGKTRRDSHTTLQQAFFETTLATVSPRYDVIQARVGIQQFNSDFRGFLLCDETLGYRLFGNADDNRWQWNAAWFPRLEKDTNSGLNELKSNGQDVYVLNLYRQDALGFLLPHWKHEEWSQGLTSQVSVHWLSTDPSVHYDENEFLVRPRLIGTVEPTEANVHWFGWTNDGHIDRINVNSALYYAQGDQDIDEVAGRRVDVSAWMAALELSIDMDWMRWRIQGLWQQGDDNPLDDEAHGFDGIFDCPNFAGGDFGFWNHQGIGLSGTGVGLVQGGSLYNTLRSSKLEGNPSFVNPGLLLLGGGWDAQLTPKLKLVTNVSHLWFDDTSSLEYLLGQGKIGRDIGWDISAGVIWRPLLTDNVIVKSGVSALVPGDGFRDIYTAETLYALFAEIILTW